MNIFYLDRNQEKCAEYHCDKHVVKMILEYAQLLSTALHVVMGDKAPDNIYKKTHINHPSAIWARQSKQNYMWLCILMSEVAEEYTRRYGREHKSMRLWDTLWKHRRELPNEFFTEPPMCMPDEYKITSSVVESYRNYYKKGKADILTYKFSETPKFLQ